MTVRERVKEREKDRNRVRRQKMRRYLFFSAEVTDLEKIQDRCENV